MCKPCAKWDFETAETWGLRYEAVGKTGRLKKVRMKMRCILVCILMNRQIEAIQTANDNSWYLGANQWINDARRCVSTYRSRVS